MNKFLISVIMPVYNAESHLRDSVMSVLNQSFSDFELIVIDDGSTDDSLNILESFHDSRICIIKNDHDYIDSLNKGINAAKGKYIARMDSDDIMLSNRLQVQFDFLEENPHVHVCGSWMQTFGTYEQVVKTTNQIQDIIIQTISANPLYHPTIMMRSEIRNYFLDNGVTRMYKHGYPCAEDYKLWTDLIVRGYIIINIPQVLLRYRVSETQVSYNRKEEMIMSTYKVQYEYIELIMEEINKVDNMYYPILENIIELYNKSKITFENLKSIVQTISINVKNKLFTKFN